MNTSNDGTVIQKRIERLEYNTHVSQPLVSSYLLSCFEFNYRFCSSIHAVFLSSCPVFDQKINLPLIRTLIISKSSSTLLVPFGSPKLVAVFLFIRPVALIKRQISDFHKANYSSCARNFEFHPLVDTCVVWSSKVTDGSGLALFHLHILACHGLLQ